MTKPARPTNNTSVVESAQQRMGCQWLHQLVNRRSYKVSMCVFVCILNVVDLFVDWYFFMSKATIQQGLVFGAPPRNTLLAIFAFCIISTFTSFLEIVQIICDTYRNRLTSLFGQITNCLTLWLEDVPLLTLNLLIVICRDGEVTYISLTKAAIGIVAVFIRFFSILLNKWLIRHDYERKDRRSQFFNAVSTMGVVLVFMLSLSIHIIASLPIDNFGRVHLEKLSDFEQFRFAHQKYFNHVGVFLRSSDDPEKYIYLTDIQNIIERSPTMFTYGVNERENVFCVKQDNQTCFKRLNDSTMEPYDNPLTNKVINYSIAFQFKQPDFYYLLGDIRYNIVRCDLRSTYIDDEKISLRYYRFKQHVNQTKAPLVSNENQTYRYYDVNQDFESLEHLWRTGLSRCSSTSSYRPHRSDNVTAPYCAQ